MGRRPYSDIVTAFTKARVQFVIVGVSGINYYVVNPENAILTQDLDLLVKPVSENIHRALKLLESEGYSLEANREPLGPVDRWLAGKIIQHRATVAARKRPFLTVDVMTEGGGFPYAAWRRRSRVFREGRFRIRVGDLEDLIRSKKNANRDKDRKFLALYEFQLKDMLESAAHPKSRKRWNPPHLPPKRKKAV